MFLNIKCCYRSLDNHVYIYFIYGSCEGYRYLLFSTIQLQILLVSSYHVCLFSAVHIICRLFDLIRNSKDFVQSVDFCVCAQFQNKCYEVSILCFCKSELNGNHLHISNLFDHNATQTTPKIIIAYRDYTLTHCSKERVPSAPASFVSLPTNPKLYIDVQSENQKDTETVW